MLFLFIACSDLKEEPEQNSNIPAQQDTAQVTEQDTAITDTAITDTAITDTAIPLDCQNISASVSWEENHVSLTLVQSDENASYYFGIAQTYRSEGLQWTGEDCHLGFSTQNGEEYRYCHPAGMGENTGVNLQYGAPFSEVQEGVNTHFTSSEFEEQVSYLLKDAISGCCWVWGEDPTYFAPLACIPLP